MFEFTLFVISFLLFDEDMFYYAYDKNFVGEDYFLLPSWYYKIEDYWFSFLLFGLFIITLN